MKKCIICKNETNLRLNIDFKETVICIDCANSITLQMTRFLVDNYRPETEKCPDCGGLGYHVEGPYSNDCYRCGGSGQVDIK